ncbi:MAG: DNA-binding protein [Leptolyngbya sp. UWPOB_LEPTO1]|uniref:DNA-binding protein n=1 Tax=Leptolyngbya sp. UWPOB_LEPTO1 TaxID=2815653 RepID=UPI001AD24FE5|nr:DNA-binding protein [Leptolyngbya sp. UWPOB_LEPTO1]MBN8565083.1 DNA-binding protein [Leptolyngbya sp. UWPOB_LEPTO1]
MASVKIELSDQQFQALQDLAQNLGIAPEELLRMSIEDWLKHPRSDFSQAADYVLHKNAELYKRLA